LKLRGIHAIYGPAMKAITHLDGALRIYTAPHLKEVWLSDISGRRKGWSATENLPH
jgi:hypothetical protein